MGKKKKTCLLFSFKAAAKRRDEGRGQDSGHARRARQNDHQHDARPAATSSSSSSTDGSTAPWVDRASGVVWNEWT